MQFTDEQIHSLRLFLQEMKLEPDYYAGQTRPFDAECIEEILGLDPVASRTEVLLKKREAFA